jgi:hypothetical protein
VARHGSRDGSFSGLGCGNCAERQALPPTSGEHTGVQTVALRTALFLSILALVMVAAFYGFVWLVHVVFSGPSCFSDACSRG